MADIFFSYSRKDKERVGLVRNALAEMGFEVFWDQETPSGSDWDTWIRGELAKSKCAVVFWSASAVASDNVRHEAVVAKEQRKLISVVLDRLPAQNLPMGFYSQQAADLSQWSGDKEDTEWRKFRREFEAKLMPRWVQQKLNDVDAELEGERAKRETSEAHEKTLRAQISKEAKIQQELKGERDRALTEIGELRGAVEERDKALQAQIAKQTETEQVLKSERESALAEAANFKAVLQDRDTLKEQTAKQADTEQGLKTERDRALADVAKLKATVEGLSRAPPDAETRWAKEPTKRWLAPIAVGIALFAAVLGGTLVSLLPSRKSDAEAETKVAELTATVTKSDKARQDAEAKANQAAAALAKSDTARQDAVAKAVQADAALTKSEQARQAAEAKAADVEKARQAAVAKAADADKARQAAEAAQAIKKQAVAENAVVTVSNGLFSVSQNTLVRQAGVAGGNLSQMSVRSVGDCEQNCVQYGSNCSAYSYSKASGACYMYSAFSELVPNDAFDSGIRKSAAQSVAGDARQHSADNPAQTDLNGFTIDEGLIAVGPNRRSAGYLPTINECLQACANAPDCRAFVFPKSRPGLCTLFSSTPTRVPDPNYVTGSRTAPPS